MSEWDGMTAEKWVEKMLREGYTEIVLMFVKTLPDWQKEKYREIYRRVREEKRRESNIQQARPDKEPGAIPRESKNENGSAGRK